MQEVQAKQKKQKMFSYIFFFIPQVVSTLLEVYSRYTGKDPILVYQMVQASQIMQVSEGNNILSHGFIDFV